MIPHQKINADEVRALRKQFGHSQAEAAAITGTSLRQFQRWESGERHMHPAFYLYFSRRCVQIVEAKEEARRALTSMEKRGAPVPESAKPDFK